jgi:hypothetical protein
MTYSPSPDDAARPQRYRYDAKMTKRLQKRDLPSKICASCGRPFTWRKKWERDWEQVRYCSKRCAGQRGKQAS